MKLETEFVELVRKAKEDWLQTFELVSVLLDSESSSDSILRHALMGLIAEMLISGVFDAGEIGDEGFESWSGVVVDKVTKAWALVADIPVRQIGLGEGAWFNLTVEGEEFALTL
jgi:hypothetical protein